LLRSQRAFQKIFNIYWAGACAEQKEVGVPAESADPHALLHQQGGQQQWERYCLTIKLQKSQHSPSGIVKVLTSPTPSQLSISFLKNSVKLI
jgi:hypothetical protein